MCRNSLCVSDTHTTFKRSGAVAIDMCTQWTTARRTAGIEQQRSGSRFTPLCKQPAVSTLGNGFDAVGNHAERARRELRSYRRLAAGDGQ